MVNVRTWPYGCGDFKLILNSPGGGGGGEGERYGCLESSPQLPFYETGEVEKIRRPQTRLKWT